MARKNEPRTVTRTSWLAEPYDIQVTQPAFGALDHSTSQPIPPTSICSRFGPSLDYASRRSPS
jgi:hypothetical protein